WRRWRPHCATLSRSRISVLILRAVWTTRTSPPLPRRRQRPCPTLPETHVTKDASPPCSQRYILRVCDGPSCGVTHESERLVEHIRGVIAKDGDLAARVAVGPFTCFGRCDEGPNCFLQAAGPDDDVDDEPEPEVLEEQRGFYPGMDETKLTRVVVEHTRDGKPVEDLVDDY
ncbi:MAG: (2Fe-2S) ferredoxin domain-containing protein, partial [Myxococcota bacterium]